jgi:uncharacterized protein (TIGR03083 family)
MDPWSTPPADTRPMFTAERADLLALLEGLPGEAWAVETPAVGWTVKDVALHLLEGDLGRLSRNRDGDATGLIPVDVDAATFVSALAAKNQRWIDAARQLSPRVVRELLAYSTRQVSEWTVHADLRAPTHVSWASQEPVPAWLDLARELTETWVHHQQIRAATGNEVNSERLPTVLRTFVWALPHQYRAAAPPGTRLQVDLDSGGVWHLVATDGRHWTLEPGQATDPAATVAFTADAAWRSFTGAAIPAGGVHTSGPDELTDPLLRVRGIIA